MSTTWLIPKLPDKGYVFALFSGSSSRLDVKRLQLKREGTIDAINHIVVTATGMLTLSVDMECIKTPCIKYLRSLKDFIEQA